MPKPHKHGTRHPSCQVCGDDVHRSHRLVVVVDGKLRFRWRLCLSCLAVKLVALDGNKGRAQVNVLLKKEKGAPYNIYQAYPAASLTRITAPKAAP